MHISFYIPEQYLPDENWKAAWKAGIMLPRKESSKLSTTHSWIYQTWALLSEAGLEYPLVTQIPKEGIVICLSGSLPSSVSSATLPSSIFLIDVVADDLPRPSAHLHILQNRAHAQRLPRSIFMPHWPQVPLIPRDSKRGSRFENLCFFGHHHNLSPELCSETWQKRLHDELGMKLSLRWAPLWDNYSDVDCVLAIRDFSRARQLHKPATKLYNAWQAGVPFIGGRDSAYAADGRSGIDYLVATSPEKALEHLKRLKEDLSFRANLVQHGYESGKNFTRQATLNRWKQLLQETLPSLASKRARSSLFQRYCFLTMQRFFCSIDRHWRS